MKVKVTAQHIKDGVPGDADACPIALALNEQLPAEEDSFGWTVDAFTAENVHTRVRLSKRAQKFVERFDNGVPVGPAIFVLKPVDIFR